MKILLFLVPLVIAVAALLYVYPLVGPVEKTDEIEIFIVPQNAKEFDTVRELAEKRFIRNAEAFGFLMSNFGDLTPPKPGGYKLSRGMNAWEVMKKINGEKDLAWVTISFCPRKEQVGEKLAEALGWNKEELNKWNTVYTNTKPEYFEGVYYPDTYLLPMDESGAQIAERFITRFNEKFSPLSDQYLAKNIKWTTGLKIASLIAREAAGKEDMKLISGIIWNRLNTDMRLQIDATMQYTLGKTADGSWWGSINLEQKRSDSPYNSYRHEGLPPTPICSPNIDAIEAALNPEETDCLYYLHDANKQIHCGETYEEHLDNIEEYLRS